MIDIRTIGLAPTLVPYADAWAMQRQIHREVVDGTRGDTLLLLEHEPVFTAGARTARHERPTDGTPVIDVDRGGKITWHGPVDVVAHVRRLEGLLIRVLAGFDVEGYRVEGRSGVWVRRPLSEDKIAAIGVRVQRGVTMHGFALNCDNSLLPFGQIVPCGISDAGVTTLSEAAGKDISPADVHDAVASAFRAEYEATVAA